jgi:exopolysaccharide biosynthesis WecB/TagA/CpsF family protein
MIRGQDIICVSSLDWEAHWTSKQQIMHRLAQTNRVLYVEEPVTALAPLKVPSHWRRWKAVVPRLRRVQAGLWVLTPPPLSPFGNMYPWINRANQTVLSGYIKWAARQIGLEDPLLWTYLPGSCALIDHLEVKAVIYHCVDEHSAFPGFIRPEVVRAYDDALTRRADLVLTSAQNLLLSRQHLNANIHHVRHAADVEEFAKALAPSLTVPADIAAIPRPRIGVVGVHDERLDTAAVTALAAADPAWQIVLVGPVNSGDVDEACLRCAPNIHLLGGRPRSELPAYLKALDVALIPYKLNELTRNIFPLKLYEYLGAGLPVVAAALPELKPFAETIALADTPEQYPELVQQALLSDSAKARRARSASVAGETWEKRVEEISALVEGVLARRRDATAERADEKRGSSRVSVLGFPLDIVDLEKAAHWVMTAAEGSLPGEGPLCGRTAIAVSFNPELVMQALADPLAAEALRSADLRYPDGVGAVWAARRQLPPDLAFESGVSPSSGPERVAGIDLAQRVLELAAGTGVGVYFLGAAPGVAEEAARRQCGRLPALRVAGCQHGYFPAAEEDSVVAGVRQSGASILLVAMGAPKQEILLYRHREEWGAAVALAVGGSFDVWAGGVKRAPEWARQAGLEWLYRLVRDPRRLRRQLALPRFAYRVLRQPVTNGTEAGARGLP